MSAIPLLTSPPASLTDGLNQVITSINSAPGGAYSSTPLPAAQGGTGPSNALPIPIPINFPYNFEGAAFSLIDNSVGPATAVCSLTAKQVFAVYSPAQSSPSATYYVNGGGASGSWGAGSDGNNGLSMASPCLTIGHAQSLANTGAVPAKIYILVGIYTRVGNTNFSITVDTAWVAVSGRVVLGVYDNFSAPSKDGTFTNCYSFTAANCDRVMDLINLDNYGHYNDIPYVSTAAICNATPGSWAKVGSTVYVNRADGAAMTNTNTRWYYTTITPITVGTASGTGINFYMGTEDGGFSGFDVEGGQSGAFLAYNTSPSGNKRVIVGEYCTYRYSGGLVGTSAENIQINSWNGFAWFFNCDASKCLTDGFAAHNGYGAPLSGMVTVNCTAFTNGSGPNVGQVSCNGWTTHESCIAADFGGYYKDGAGGLVRSIGSSISLLAGTTSENDKGDVSYGGATQPTAFFNGNTSTYYLFRPKAVVQGGQRAFCTSETAVMKIMQPWPTKGSTGGTGTISTVTSW